MVKKLGKFANLKLSIAIVGIVLAASMSITGIGAYLTDADTVINQVSIGSVETEIVETFTPPTNLKPNDTITKKVAVTNTGKSSCYVRVRALFTNSDMEKFCTVDWNTTDWAYNAIDGFYYYKKAIASGTTTTNLCTTVKISSTATNLKPFNIIVYAESYEATRFSTYQAAWKYYERNK